VFAGAEDKIDLIVFLAISIEDRGGPASPEEFRDESCVQLR